MLDKKKEVKKSAIIHLAANNGQLLYIFPK